MEILKQHCINGSVFITLIKTDKGYVVGKGAQKIGTYDNLEMAERTFKNVTVFNKRPVD